MLTGYLFVLKEACDYSIVFLALLCSFLKEHGIIQR